MLLFFHHGCFVILTFDSLLLYFLGWVPNSGVHIGAVVMQLQSQGGYSENEVRNAVGHLCEQGYIYSTIDEFHFQYIV